ncbi:matrixin family metalloprotease [Streptomyces sp. B21-105]|uniref:matrixin family metalloprotease n=1 Tax=Streptomyces sp. B21-105 TaxID=3039417 RepID=UPI002FF112FE
MAGRHGPDHPGRAITAFLLAATLAALCVGQPPRTPACSLARGELTVDDLPAGSSVLDCSAVGRVVTHDGAGLAVPEPGTTVSVDSLTADGSAHGFTLKVAPDGTVSYTYEATHPGAGHGGAAHAGAGPTGVAQPKSPHAKSPHAKSPHAETPHAETPHAETPHAETPHAGTAHARAGRTEAARAQAAPAEAGAAGMPHAGAARTEAVHAGAPRTGGGRGGRADAPAPCADDAYVTAGRKAYGPYEWFLGDGHWPGGISRAGARRAFEEAVATITASRNDCGLEDRVAAKARYVSTTSSEADIDRETRCMRPDGLSVWDAGDLGPESVATTCSWSRPAPGGGPEELLEADVRFNTHDHAFTDDPSGACTQAYDLRSVATHEAGHVFGLAHSGAGHENLTMFASSFACSTSARTLGKGDVLGLRSLYWASPDTNAMPSGVRS